MESTWTRRRGVSVRGSVRDLVTSDEAEWVYAYSLPNFDITWSDDSAHRYILRVAREQCWEYVGTCDGWLYIHGQGHGTGKTHLAAAVATIITRHLFVVYGSASDLFSARSVDERRAIQERCENAPCLVIEDIGNEPAPDAADVAWFNRLLETRLVYARPTIFTSLYRLEELAHHRASYPVARISDHAVCVSLDGVGDYRDGPFADNPRRDIEMETTYGWVHGVYTTRPINVLLPAIWRGERWCPVCNGQLWILLPDPLYPSTYEPRRCDCWVPQELELDAEEITWNDSLSTPFDRVSTDWPQDVEARAILAHAKAQCEAYAHAPTGWLFLCGDHGIGKLFDFAYATAAVWTAHGQQSVSLSVNEIDSFLLRNYDLFTKYGTEIIRTDYFTQADCLLVRGMSYVASVFLHQDKTLYQMFDAVLLDILTAREDRPTIITSEMPCDHLGDEHPLHTPLSPAVVDLLEQRITTTVTIGGPDYWLEQKSFVQRQSVDPEPEE